MGMGKGMEQGLGMGKGPGQGPVRSPALSKCVKWTQRQRRGGHVLLQGGERPSESPAAPAAQGRDPQPGFPSHLPRGTVGSLGHGRVTSHGTAVPLAPSAGMGRALRCPGPSVAALGGFIFLFWQFRFPFLARRAPFCSAGVIPPTLLRAPLPGALPHAAPSSGFAGCWAGKRRRKALHFAKEWPECPGAF